MPESPATALLHEALDFFAAVRIEVLLSPVAGMLTLKGETVSTGDRVAKAITLGMLGVGAPLQ